MKAIWKGALSFGLVNIPVNVYPASEAHSLEFHMLHAKDLSPIRFARICKECGKEVEFKDIVKGYEYEKGEYIVIDEGDFKAAQSKKSDTIEIEYFTNLDQIHPVYFEKPYFLEPSKKALKAYQLLFEALKKSKKIAIANFVFRNRGHFGAILSSNEGLILLQMRYPDSLRESEELVLPAMKHSEKELKLAMGLIEQLSQDFAPDKQHDRYNEDLLEVIEQKAKGKKRKVAKSKPSKEAPIVRDLMALLQESMKEKKSQKSPQVPPPVKRQKRKHV